MHAIMILLTLVFSLAAVVFWIWVLIDCVTNEPSGGDNKIVWVLIILLANWLGAVLYFIIRRPERMNLYGK